MRCAIFLAIACVALSAPTTEENIQAEEVNPLTSEVSGSEFAEAYHPVKVDSSATGKVLLESDLAARGPYWKWANKYQQKADGNYRLRQKFADGKVVKNDWALIEATAKKKPEAGKKKKNRPSSEETVLVAPTEPNAPTAPKEELATNGRKLLGKGGRRRRAARCTRRGNMVRWGGGRKRVGRHLHGQRMLYTWHCNRWIYRRWWWALLRRNAYNHRLHGRLQWRWTNHYKRIGVHRYRYQSLYRNYQGRWRRIGGKWRLNRRNAYYRGHRWFPTRHTKRHGRYHYRLYSLKRWTGSHWVTIRRHWHRVRRGERRALRRRPRRSLVQAPEKAPEKAPEQ